MVQGNVHNNSRGDRQLGALVHRGEGMHPTARRCIGWAVALITAGAVLLVFVPQIYVAIANLAGANAEAGVALVDVVLTIVRWTMIPVGASLIGAAVVIQTLAPQEDRSEQEDRSDEGQWSGE